MLLLTSLQATQVLRWNVDEEEQNHQKTETQYLSKDHAERWTILKKTVQNCEISKKCNCKYIDSSNNSLSDQVRMLWHHHNNAK